MLYYIKSIGIKFLNVKYHFVHVLHKKFYLCSLEKYAHFYLAIHNQMLIP